MIVFSHASRLKSHSFASPRAHTPGGNSRASTLPNISWDKSRRCRCWQFAATAATASPPHRRAEPRRVISGCAWSSTCQEQNERSTASVRPSLRPRLRQQWAVLLERWSDGESETRWTDGGSNNSSPAPLLPRRPERRTRTSACNSNV